jgi:hypothetical protein
MHGMGFTTGKIEKANLFLKRIYLRRVFVIHNYFSFVKTLSRPPRF